MRSCNRIFRTAILLLTAILGMLPYLPATWAAHLLPVSIAALPILGITLLLTLFGDKPWRWAHAISLLFCLPVIGAYIPHLRHHPTADHPTLSILSWNAANFHVKRDTMLHATRYIRQQQPGIICLQERPHDILIHWSDIRTSLPGYRYATRNSREDEVLNLAILSQYPILASGERIYEGTYNKYMWADVRINHDTVRIFNVHLQTTGMRKNLGIGKTLIRRLVGNAVIRNHQTDDLCHDIAASPHPVILCGDLNDTPSGYPVRRLRRQLHDLSSQWPLQGTYLHLGGIMKIDYIMASPGITVADYHLHDTPWSDHKIQQATLLLKQQ